MRVSREHCRVHQCSATPPALTQFSLSCCRMGQSRLECFRAGSTARMVRSRSDALARRTARAPDERPPCPLQVTGRRLALHVSAASVSSNDFKTGMQIEFDGAPYKVVGAQDAQGAPGSHLAARASASTPQGRALAAAAHHSSARPTHTHAHKHPLSPTHRCPTEFLHVKPGKGAAFVRSKLKNFISGNTVERTWRAGESVELASVEKKDSQFTYADGDDVSTQPARWMRRGFWELRRAWGGLLCRPAVPSVDLVPPGSTTLAGGAALAAGRCALQRHFSLRC